MLSMDMGFSDPIVAFEELERMRGGGENRRKYLFQRPTRGERMLTKYVIRERSPPECSRKKRKRRKYENMRRQRMSHKEEKVAIDGFPPFAKKKT